MNQPTPSGRPRTWIAKFGDVFRGIRYGVPGQSSFRVHFLAAIAVVVAGAWLQVTAVEWCLLVLSIVAVLATELLNTALEWLAKAVTQQHDQRVGTALDIAGAAVLVVASGAGVVGLIVFLPRLWQLVAAA